MSSKFVIVATPKQVNGEWGIEYDMKQEDMHTTKFQPTGSQEMAMARAGIFNRTRQHGKAGLNMIGNAPTPNNFVKLG